MLAGAGTGKTAVISGKVAHLVCSEGVPPEEILVLAFNRKAAGDIRERLPDDLTGARVATFHAFGLRLIAAVDVAGELLRLDERLTSFHGGDGGRMSEQWMISEQHDADGEHEQAGRERHARRQRRPLGADLPPLRRLTARA